MKHNNPHPFREVLPDHKYRGKPCPICESTIRYVKKYQCVRCCKRRSVERQAKLGRIDPESLPSKEKTERRRSAELILDKRELTW